MLSLLLSCSLDCAELAVKLLHMNLQHAGVVLFLLSRVKSVLVLATCQYRGNMDLAEWHGGKDPTKKRK